MGGLGFAAVLAFLYFIRERLRFNWKDYIEYVVVCTVFGAALARVLYVIALLPSMENITIREILFQLWNGGIVFYGGLFGVILGIAAVSKYRGRSSKNILNTIAPAFPLFHTFARIGCLLAGCCYGTKWNWGVILSGEEDIVRLPVQLFESGCNLFIFIMLMVLRRRKKTCTCNLAIYLCSYAICRFILEFFRGDTIRGIWGTGLSTAQSISVIILLYYMGRVVASGFQKRKTGKVVEE